MNEQEKQEMLSEFSLIEKLKAENAERKRLMGILLNHIDTLDKEIEELHQKLEKL